MINILLNHEILNLLKSRRVYWTVVMFLLLFASVFIVRVIDYQKQINQYIADVKITEEGLQNADNYSGLNPRAIQQPIIFSIYNQGHKIGRVINVIYYEPITSSMSLNEENNKLYRENNQLDITFLITFFLSLFILLISYDSVNGEKQVGTLRLFMTFPLKRQNFILKKILGVFFFVSFTFTIPYILSLITLIVLYANLLSLNFFLSAFFYWFLVLLFIFFFSLLGIFISCCSTNPNRSLVFALLTWILLSIVLPISWEYIISPKLYTDKLNILQQNYYDKNARLNLIERVEVPDEANINYVGHMNWSNFFYDSTVWGFTDTYEQHYRFQRYMIDNYYPAAREAEQANDAIRRQYINIENVKNLVFFYNPIVLFKNLSAKIAGNSREDYQKFIQDSRGIRDDLVQLGISEEWLLDYRFFALYKNEYSLGSQEEFFMKVYKDFRGTGDPQEFLWEKVGWDAIWEIIQDIMRNDEYYEMVLPNFRRYQQPEYTFGEVFARIFVYIVMFVVSILVLWVLTWQKFMRYDVR